MTEMFAVTFRATGEVRDAEGNLLSSEPIEITTTMTADEVRALTEGEPQ